MRPAHSIVFSAQVLGAYGPLSVGDVVIPMAPLANTDNERYYVLATSANRGTRRSEAVVLSAFGGSGVGSVELQQSGTLDASITGLGSAATRQLVRCSAVGRIERVAAASSTDDIIGYAEIDGRVTLYPRLPFVELGTLLFEGGTAITIANGGTGQSEIGAPGQVLRVNALGTGLEWWTP